MELQHFIAMTLSQIVHGISDARLHLGDLGEHVNPEITSHTQIVHTQGKLKSNGRLVHFIDFDVAVAVTSSQSASGGATIGVVSTGGNETSSTTTGQNRIRFSVPITLPDAGA